MNSDGLVDWVVDVKTLGLMLAMSVIVSLSIIVYKLDTQKTKMSQFMINTMDINCQTIEIDRINIIVVQNYNKQSHLKRCPMKNTHIYH